MHSLLLFNCRVALWLQHTKAKSRYLSCAAVLTVTQPFKKNKKKNLILINHLPFLSLLSPGLGKCQLNTSQRTINRPNGWSPSPKVMNSLSLMTGGRLKLSTFFCSSSWGWMSSSGPGKHRGFLGWRHCILQSDSTLDQFTGETSAHSEEQDLQREWQDPSPEAAFEI